MRRDAAAGELRQAAGAAAASIAAGNRAVTMISKRSGMFGMGVLRFLPEASASPRINPTCLRAPSVALLPSPRRAWGSCSHSAGGPRLVTLISKRGGMLRSGVLRLLPRQRVFVLRFRRLPWAPSVACLRALGVSQAPRNNAPGGHAVAIRQRPNSELRQWARPADRYELRHMRRPLQTAL